MKTTVILCCLLLCFSCHVRNSGSSTASRSITDALDRKVILPDSIRRVVCLRASAIRLVSYAGGTPLICGVEEQECHGGFII